MEGALVKLALVFALLTAQYSLVLSLRAQDVPWVAPPRVQDDKWDAALFRTLAFGHLPVLVDLFWIRAHQDPSYFHVAPGSHPPAYFDFELITDLDPLFADVYTTGSSIVAVVRNDGPGARDLLLKGQRFRLNELASLSPDYKRRYWAREWEIPLLLAYVYLFELNDLPTAARYFVEASQIKGSPRYLAHLASRLEAPGGQFEVGLSLLNSNIEAARDPAIKAEWVRKRNSLVVVKFLTAIRADYNSFMASARALTGEQALRAFLAARKLPPVDPWGGRLELNSRGLITTTTPYAPVLGIQ